MPECARCSDFTDNPSNGECRYCDTCQEAFQAVRQRGVIVEQVDDGYHVYVTANDDRYGGGVEPSQVDGLARGKHIADELGVDALFSYDQTGSRWLLEEYLRAHPGIRQEVTERVSRVPNREDGLLDRVRGYF